MLINRLRQIFIDAIALNWSDLDVTIFTSILVPLDMAYTINDGCADIKLNIDQLHFKHNFNPFNKHDVSFTYFRSINIQAEA